MKYLFSEFSAIRKEIAARPVYLMLDFDGTLAAIRRNPGDARLSRANAAALKAASLCRGIHLAVVSGRSLKDIRKRTGLKGITYAGNHGLEIQGPGIRFTAPGAAGIKKVMGRLAKQLKREFREIKGVIVEDKGFSISVHFRMVKKSEEGTVATALREVTAPYESKKKITVMTGKKIWELRPPVKWDKGKTALLLIKKKNKDLGGGILPIYMGDDRTDEDAFRAIGKKGICVFVGRPGKSAAGYYLKRTGEVAGFIREAVKIKKGDAE